MRDPTILVVDDEPQIREVLRSGLEAEGWQVRIAADRQGLFDVLAREPVDLVTLDLGLGRDDGLSLARELRTVRNVPILLISARTGPFDRVEGLEAGADDYIVKPFHIREVVLRVRNALERYGAEVALPASIGFDHSVFDPVRRSVRHRGGGEVELTDTEMKLLGLFLHHPNRVLSRDEISRALHGRDWSPTDRSIDVHVANLRRKVEGLKETPELLRSVRGVGYVFTGAVLPA